jgi:hypothetical protein
MNDYELEQDRLIRKQDFEFGLEIEQRKWLKVCRAFLCEEHNNDCNNEVCLAMEDLIFVVTDGKVSK